jgi:hypothetical protein
MKRRDFIAGLAGATACPFAAGAQQPANSYRIAIVRPSGSAADMTEALRPTSRFLKNCAG